MAITPWVVWDRVMGKEVSAAATITLSHCWVVWDGYIESQILILVGMEECTHTHITAHYDLHCQSNAK